MRWGFRWRAQNRLFSSGRVAFYFRNAGSLKTERWLFSRGLCTWLDSLTSLKNVHIRGVHLLMPGCGRAGPTLEIFQYSGRRRRTLPQTDQPGFGHIAFAVTNVAQMIKRLEKNGGSLVGKRITTTIEGVGKIDVVYARDPEGNIVELQKWS